MNEQQFLKLIAGQPMPGGRLLRFLLRVASWPYAAGCSAIGWLIRIRRVHAAGSRSGGNLTGGHRQDASRRG